LLRELWLNLFALAGNGLLSLCPWINDVVTALCFLVVRLTIAKIRRGGAPGRRRKTRAWDSRFCATCGPLTPTRPQSLAVLAAANPVAQAAWDSQALS